MEPELDPRLKAFPFKVRAASRESVSQKAAHVLDSDLRTHWSTGTNTKEWIVLELEESCLLSHIRIHNKSVLEWEISVGLKHKPETFLKVRPRCEAPRRDMTYHVGHIPCRFVRISCLRGNPIAIFFVQLMGIPVPGLEPEFQPVVDYLLPHIVSQKQDLHAVYLKLLQDITSRLSPFLPQLEGELTVSSDMMESSIRLLAMLVGPFYPILNGVGGRDSDKTSIDTESVRSSQPSVFSVSSNFQAPPKRVRSPGAFQAVGHTLAYRSDVILLLLKAACKDNALATVCKKIARIFSKFAGRTSSDVKATEPSTGFPGDVTLPNGTKEATVGDADASSADYAAIFGEEFKVADDDDAEISHSGILDSALIEEGLLHVLYGLVSQPALCRRLADITSDLLPVLPFIQAIIPALRPSSSMANGADIVDERFLAWQAPQVQRAITQVVALSTSPSYHLLLDSCAGYLASYSAAHEKAACILIDLCTASLSPWLHMVIAKVDLAIELIEDLLGVIQAGHQAITRTRAALVYLMLALSGYVDDILEQYKDVKHSLLFLIEMLEPFLVPVITPVKSTIAFGDVSAVLSEKQDNSCALALDFICTAVRRPAVLPALEAEWRRGHVAPSVLLSILAPQLPLPHGLDTCASDKEPGSLNTATAPYKFGEVVDAGNVKVDATFEGGTKVDVEDANYFFAPPEVKGMSLTKHLDGLSRKVEADDNTPLEDTFVLNQSTAEQYFKLQADYLQLVNSAERELRASEFIRFAMELHSRTDTSVESHQAAIDALLLAAECHLNPFFMDFQNKYQQMLIKVTSSREDSKGITRLDNHAVEMLTQLEEDRDKAVLRILLQAAQWDSDLIPERSDSADGFEGLSIDADDAEVEDATTVVRERQSLLCRFFIHQLQRETHNMYDVLLQGLLFVLESTTGLHTPPEGIIEVILRSAQRLNKSVSSHYSRTKEGSASQSISTVYGIRRQWGLLIRLVYAAAGRSFMEQDDLSICEGHLAHKELVPAWAWLEGISKFAVSSYPLVRYIGWMALSTYAKAYHDNGLHLVSGIEQLTGVLVIFSDELASVEAVTAVTVQQVDESLRAFDAQLKAAGGTRSALASEKIDHQEQQQQLVHALYPELHIFFPRLRSQFSQFAETLLDAVCDQMKSLSPMTVPDLLSWFTELCYDPFPQHKEESKVAVKGFAVANVKHVILRLLKVIVVEHMEAIVPELPRIIRMLLRMCSSSYCDISMLESVLSALKPIVTYTTTTGVSNLEGQLPGSFNDVCFGALLDQLKEGPEVKKSSGALLLFLSGYLLSDVSSVIRAELISSLLAWVDFRKSCTTGSYYNYLCAFETILESLRLLMEGSLVEPEWSTYHGTGLSQVNSMQSPQVLTGRSSNASSPDPPSAVSADAGVIGEIVEPETDFIEISRVTNEADAVSNEGDNIVGFDESNLPFQENGLELYARSEASWASSNSSSDWMDENLEGFLHALGPQLEASWRFHPKFVSRIAGIRARCLLLASYFRTKWKQRHKSDEKRNGAPMVLNEEVQAWDLALSSLTQSVTILQKARCWQVAAATMDFILSLPSSFHIHEVLPELCSVLEYQCAHAPRLSWRLRTGKWLSRILQYVGVELSKPASSPLVLLLNTMLEHPEPEQRSGALRQLKTLLEMSEHMAFSGVEDANLRYSYDKFVRKLVPVTWDKVASLAASDSLIMLRQQSLELLLKFVPLAQPIQLQSFLGAVDAIFPGATSVHMMKSGPLTRLALALLARICLYSSPEDMVSIPTKVWTSIEYLANARPGTIFLEQEKAVCQSLLQLRELGFDAKQNLENALVEGAQKPKYNPEFLTIRETVLEVFARLDVFREKEESYAAAAREAAKEMEEAEIELELLKEQSKDTGGFEMDTHDVIKRLRAKILAEERAAVRADVAARRERRRIAHRERQIALEEAAEREIEILQELDRERVAEAEREIERQKALEKERAKTRELRHALDLELERRAQREYQRELEGGTVRTTRREYATSTSSSRPRDRYQREGSSRPDRENAVTPPPTPIPSVAGSPTSTPLAGASAQSPIVMTSSRAYPSQSLGFQNRERSEERPYEDLLGNGAISDYGDFENGEPGSTRQGARPARSRQIMERRERDGRREGKWERKQT